MVKMEFNVDFTQMHTTIEYFGEKEAIETYDEWERIFKEVKPKHWKEGRSAQSLADFMMKKDGFACVKNLVGKAIGKPLYEIEKVTIEGRVAFDDNNHSREHDLAVVARTESNQSVFIGVEAKVDESFGSTIKQYETAARKKSENSKVPSRIKGLKEYFPKAKDDVFQNLQYQLATATAGTLCAKTDQKSDYDFYVFMVLVFKTSLYNDTKGKKNKMAFELFLNAIGAKAIGAKESAENIYGCEVKGKSLKIIYKEISCCSC